ncbi:hypothetical protein K7432_002064 [Basidiobolus ranarum]|uniref:Glycosyltransferase 61 catalytic domain-containing protein n=1 Tax=Basidiobolus ranarum TaxID=34480 RepID=A0ABR2X271_9FUNG
MAFKVILKWLISKHRLFFGFIILIVLFFSFRSRTLDRHDREYQKWMSEHPQLVSTGPVMEDSTWECTGTTPRTRICTYQNLCIDRKHGAYIRVRDPTALKEKPPLVNLISVGTTEDIHWAPEVRPIMSFWKPTQGVDVDLIDETLFVYGLYSPFHFSHQLYNGLLPLYSVMKEFKASRNAWTFRPRTFWFQPHIIDLDFITSGKDIVFAEDEAATDHQILPPSSRPICFSRAIVGGGTRCSHNYCERFIPQQHMNQFRDDVLDYYVHNDAWNKTVAQSTEKSLQCTKQVEIFPPTSDQLSDTPVIGILNRKNSRRVTNMDEAVSALRKAIPYAEIKILSFDSGCSLAATAKLMEDIDVFITSFGNGVGCNIFQRSNRVTISIEPRNYSEDWFMWPSTCMGRRIHNLQCTRRECQVKDYDLAKKMLLEYGAKFTQEDIEELANAEDVPYKLCDRLVPERGYTLCGIYSKDAQRKAEIGTLVPSVRKILDEMISTGASWKNHTDNLNYSELCTEGKCCGPKCAYVMKDTIFSGSQSSWGLTGEGKDWKLQ